jgi:hypothetical protein
MRIARALPSWGVLMLGAALPCAAQTAPADLAARMDRFVAGFGGTVAV